MLELLSLVFHLLRRMAPGEWLLVIGLSWWGLIKNGQGATSTAQIAWGIALLLILLSLSGKAVGYVLFRPESGGTAPAGPLPPVLYGRASGSFRTRRGPLEIEGATHLYHIPVQLRWMGGQPPYLAVLEPAELLPTVAHPTASAESWSLWYPGSQVRTGWLYAAGRKQYGLELRFVGKRLYLALDDEIAAEQVRSLLQLPS